MVGFGLAFATQSIGTPRVLSTLLADWLELVSCTYFLWGWTHCLDVGLVVVSWAICLVLLSKVWWCPKIKVGACQKFEQGKSQVQNRIQNHSDCGKFWIGIGIGGILVHIMRSRFTSPQFPHKSGGNFDMCQNGQFSPHDPKWPWRWFLCRILFWIGTSPYFPSILPKSGILPQNPQFQVLYFAREGADSRAPLVEGTSCLVGLVSHHATLSSPT